MKRRQLEILLYLLDVKKTTCAVLAQRFEVSQRTILRDLDKLSATAECFCPRRSVRLTEAFPHAAACDELCSTRWGWVESQPQPCLQREFGPFLRALRRTKEKAG